MASKKPQTPAKKATTKKAPAKKQSPVKKATTKKPALIPVTVKSLDPETSGVYIGDKLQANLFGSKNTCNMWAEAIRGNIQAQKQLFKSVYNMSDEEAINETNKKYS